MIMWTSGEFSSEYGEFQGENPEGTFESIGEMSGEFQSEAPLNEALEMELASELLSVTNEQELNHFLGGLVKKVGGFLKSPVGQALGGVLKGIAKQALPVVGGALGSFVAPGVGTAIGSSLGSMAGKMFGLELEGLSQEDREFEVARRFVRLASSAAQKAALAPPTISPVAIARKAIALAAQTHAPGLCDCARNAQQFPAQASASFPTGPSAWPGQPVAAQAQGRWIRRGRAIVLYGL